MNGSPRRRRSSFTDRMTSMLSGLWPASCERKNGNVATYILNRYINYSNICVLSCQFCAFAAKKRDSHAFESSTDEIVAAVREALARGITEVHMVGGLHPTLDKQWYLDLLKRLRALDSQLQLKAFTAIEIRHLAR